ncbi:hypothetical protein [Lactobacillus brevis] [Lactiplantibacillus mudanjiangensis]|uniref:hypothetical protein n=1 Tax=Lactiplantibacillus mudanjiangensis TaxID=1296538 RepID=UPI0010159FAA|nr:hypothetical protein [Lactobacillus brevis] [Lactiplantibacillus mudanjiangensis]
MQKTINELSELNDYADREIKFAKRLGSQIISMCELISPTLKQVASGNSSYLTMNTRQLHDLVEDRELSLYQAVNMFDVISSLAMDLDSHSGHVQAAIAGASEANGNNEKTSMDGSNDPDKKWVREPYANNGKWVSNSGNSTGATDHE